MKLPDTEAGLLKLIADANVKLRAVKEESAKLAREEGAAVLKVAKAGGFAVIIEPFGKYVNITQPNGKTVELVANKFVNKGDVFKVYAVQPRKEIVWLITDDRRIFKVSTSYLSRIRTYKDELTAQVAACAR